MKTLSHQMSQLHSTFLSMSRDPGTARPKITQPVPEYAPPLMNFGKALDRPRPIGIGHNRPPEEEEEPDEIKELRAALPALSAELAKATPSISLVKQWAIPLRNAVIVSSKWAWKKIDKGLDAAVAAAGTGGVAWIGAHYSVSLHNAFEAVVNWLEIAAKTLF
jgi:hypothetical protein